ncbi:MAG: alpha-2-macroglobulin family protein, partial [Bacteroidetes bacterium]
MKRTKQLLFVFALLLFSTCTRNLLEINAGSLKNEVATKENITFNFTKPIATDSMLNRWDTTQFVQLQPRVAGKFKWTKPDELVFSPVEGFLPSTDYSVQMGKALEKMSGGKKIPINASQNLKFHTTYLQFEKAEAFWVKNDMNTPQLRVNLKFNYKVRHQNISPLISVRVGEQAVQAVRVLNTEPSNTLELVMEEGGSVNLSNQTLQIVLQAGIACAESDFKTKEPITHTLTTPDSKTLKIESISATYEKERPVIKVRTSQSVTLEQLKENFKIEPRLVYELHPSEGGFTVKGFFKQGNKYNVKFAQNLQGSLGARLGNDQEQMVEFKEEQPYIQFSEDKGTYLSNAGSRNVGLRISQVPRITVKIYKIYENNLQHFLRQMGGYQDYRGDGEYGLDNYADVIFEREYQTKQLPLVNGSHLLTLDNEKLKGNKGLFYVYVNSTENQWLKDSKMISLSDIGFIVRETKEDILVFTNSLLTTQPLKNLPVQIISQSNQIIATQNTDEQGVTVFKHIKRKFPKADVQLITAQGANDYNFIYLSGTGIDKSDFETGGKHETESGYQAFMYGERNLYRPGETININSIVRTRDWQPINGMPVIFRLNMPNGKEFTSRKVVLDAQGSYSASIKLPPNAMTGTYTAKIETSTGESLERLDISVEEFMPDRIKVLLSFLDKDMKSDKVGEIVPDDSLRVLLKARNLFGPPAINKNFQMSFSLRSEDFEPKAFTNYTFALDRRGENGDYFNPENQIEVKETEGKTNDKGNFYQAFYLPKSLKNHGLLYGQVFSTVFDETGRGVSRARGFQVVTQPYMIGLKRGLYYAVPNEPMNIELIAVKADETPTAGKAKVKILQYKWQNTLERSPNSEEMRYVSQRKLEVVSEQTIDINASGALVNFTPKEVGEYETRVILPDAETYLKQHFYVYTPAYIGGGNNKNDAFPIDKKGKVDIKLDKLTYQIGNQAKVLFTTPFNGKMLVTVERYGVYTHQYVEVKNRTASILVDIKKEFLPNVYITATLIKPSTDGAIPLTVAHGFANLAVDEPSTHLDLKIEAVERTQTHQKQTIKVQASAGTAVTLAIVDEGILQIKNYETPNAHTEFYTKRALEVNSYNIYPRLFPELNMNRSSTGGDGFELAGRANPMVNKRVKLVSFWSGILQTNAAGEAFFTIDIPQFSGSLRIMALAYKDGAFGHAQKNMIVADPVVVSTGFPRFLAPEDRVTVPVTLFNTTKENINAQVVVTSTDALNIKGKSTQEVELKAGSEDEVKFEVQAENKIDSAKITITVQGAGKTFVEELYVNVRPITGFVKHFGSGMIEDGKLVNLTFPNDLVPTTSQGRLVVSKSPLVQFANNFEYLVQYPHGCVEQVTSGAFPQLYVQDLLKVISPEKQNLDLLQAQARFFVQEAIYKLQSMQTYSG